MIDVGGRFRRQAGPKPTIDEHTEEATTQTNLNIKDDTGFGKKLFPEEYNVRHASCLRCLRCLKLIDESVLMHQEVPCYVLCL